MMNSIKQIILIAGLFSSSMSLLSQVGIYTKNPLGVFHIDAGKDNPVLGAPSAAQQLNDFAVVVANNGDALVGVGTVPAKTSNAQLELAVKNKAMLLNNVQLNSITDVKTIENPRAGILAYNIKAKGDYPIGISQGLHYFNGYTWDEIESGIKQSVTNIRLLQSNLEPPKTSAATDISNALASAETANFTTMKIKDQGAYTFALRLYGVALDPSIPTERKEKFERTIFYIYLMKKDAKTSVLSVVDQFGINTVAFFVNDALTYTAVLRGYFNVDDEVIVKLSYKAPYSWRLISNPSALKAARTSLVFWK